MPRVRAILLDYDGTLTKPFFDWGAMRAEMGIADEAVPMLDFIARASPEEAARASAVLERHEAESVRRAELNEGADVLLAFLRERAVPHGVVTNNARRFVAPALARLGVEVPLLITRDIGCWKPSPEPLLRAASALGFDPSRCALLGDSPIDMLAGRRAGCLTIGLCAEGALDCEYPVGGLAEAVRLLRRLLR